MGRGGMTKGGWPLSSPPRLAAIIVVLTASRGASESRKPELQKQEPTTGAQELEVEIFPHGGALSPRSRAAGALIRTEQPEDVAERAHLVGVGAGDNGDEDTSDAEPGFIASPAPAPPDQGEAATSRASNKQWYDRILGTWNNMVRDSSSLESNSMAWFNDLYLKKVPAVKEANEGLASARETMFTNLNSNLAASKKAIETYHGAASNSTLSFWAKLEGKLKELTLRLNQTADLVPETIGRLREAESQTERQLRDYKDRSISTLEFVEQEAGGMSEAQGKSQQEVSSILNRYEEIVGNVAAQLNKTRKLDENETTVLMYFIMHPSSPRKPDKMTAAEFGKFMRDQEVDMAQFGRASEKFEKSVMDRLSKLSSKITTVQNVLNEKLKANTHDLKDKVLEKLNTTEHHFDAEEQAERAGTKALFQNVLSKFRADDKVTQTLYDSVMAMSTESEKSSKRLSEAFNRTGTFAGGNTTQLGQGSNKSSVQQLHQKANASQARIQDAMSQLGALLRELRGLHDKD